LPQQFNVIHPWRVDWLINNNKFWVLLQPPKRFTTFMDDVVINDRVMLFARRYFQTPKTPLNDVPIAVRITIKL